MSLPRESWLHLTEGMQPGERRRRNHGCGPGTTLLLSRDADGFRAWCFRCGEGDHAPPPAESLAEKAERISRQARADASIQRAGTELPEPREHDLMKWPAPAVLWLLKAGLGAPEIKRLGAYYHPPSDRVVLPVFDPSTGLPVFWQARAVDSRQPKYMAPPIDRATVLPRFGAAASPTLTEDLLSAFKVGLVGEGWALMGTRLNSKTLAELLARGCTVNVWMDNDLPPKFPVNRGQIAARKILAQLRAYGIPCRNIVSDRDPKLHNRAEIKDLLCPL